MRSIDDATRQKIRDHIAEVEMHCDSELVCLITQRSARYVLFPLLLAAIAALFLPVLNLIAHFANATSFAITFQHQTIIFVILAVVFVFTPLSHMLTPQWLKQQNCDRFSTAQFFSQQLHETPARNAILIFVSWEEKFVTIVADKGINEKVQQSDWDDLIAGFVRQIQAGDLEAGFLEIIDGYGALLKTHFPLATPKTDALPNHLITFQGNHAVS